MAALGDRDIARCLEELFEADTADPRRIRGAKYDLTLGRAPLVLPDGRRYSGDDGAAPPRRFLLRPGESALVSTRERIAMPTRLSGILGPAYELSEEGILMFGGMLVDPGFGYRHADGEWIKEPQPLSFFLANLGTEPFLLAPDKQRIASIAFVEVSNARSLAEFDPRLETKTAQAVWAEQLDPQCDDPPKSLGLVRGIRELEREVQKFKASTFQVVLFGVIVLAVTLFAATVSLLVTETGKSIVLSLEWHETLATLGLIATVPAALTGSFYLWVAAMVRWRELRGSEQRNRRPASEA